MPVKVRAAIPLALSQHTRRGTSQKRAQIIYGLVNYGNCPPNGFNGMATTISSGSDHLPLHGSTGPPPNTSFGVSAKEPKHATGGHGNGVCPAQGDSGGMDLRVITEIAEFFENELNYEIPPRTPFAGRAFNATRAGIHADGLLKDEEIYNIFDTTKILGRPPVVVVDKHSGLAGVAAWLNNYFMLKGDKAIDKRDEKVARIKAWIDKEYENGRTTALGDAEMEQLAKEYFPELLSLRQSRVEELFNII